MPRKSLIIKMILADQLLDAAARLNVGNATKGTCEQMVLRERAGLEGTFPLDSGTDSRVHTSEMSDHARGLRSGELASAAGVSTDTLRHYERIGVLAEAPRTQSGYRLYPADSLERVHMIRHALQLGFTLAELAEILRTRDQGGVPCKRVLEMLEDKLTSLEEQILELQKLKGYMAEMVGDWRSKVGQSGPGKRVHLLHSLMAASVPGATNGSLRGRRKQR